MTRIRLTCSSCRQTVSVAHEATVFGRGSDLRASLALRCPACEHVEARVLDGLDAAELIASHVPCTSARRAAKPDPAPALSRLTPDDALEFHLALQRPGWFDELVSAGSHSPHATDGGTGH